MPSKIYKTNPSRIVVLFEVVDRNEPHLHRQFQMLEAYAAPLVEAIPMSERQWVAGEVAN